MAWDDPGRHPARRIADHPNGAAGFAALEVTVPGEPELATWLGGALPPTLKLTPGPDGGPTRLLVSVSSGLVEIV